jgi:lysophospholipase L1-like esterase
MPHRHRAPLALRQISLRLAGILFLSLAALPARAAADTPCPRAARQAVSLPATRAALLAHKPITIIAFGSSSTQGSGATGPDHTYPAQLQALLKKRWPDSPVVVVNKGIGGETINNMMARLNTDVIEAKPILVIWQTGTNDALRHMDPQRFTQALQDGVRKIIDSGADVILMDDQLSPRLAALDDQTVYDDIIAQEAETTSAQLFARSKLMQTWLGEGEPISAFIGPDGLHHTDRGYTCVATALADSIVNGSAMAVGGKR